MVRLEFSIELDYQIDVPGCDFIFSIHAAQTRHQSVRDESLEIRQDLPPNLHPDPPHTRFLRLKAFTLVEEVGVCRDFAYTMIALCRAANIPARFAATMDFGADPILGPTDFHVCVEVYLGDRWYIFDPSGVAIPMDFVRIGTGRDAADTAFPIIFGGGVDSVPVIRIAAIADAQGLRVVPQHLPCALYTDGQAPSD